MKYKLAFTALILCTSPLLAIPPDVDENLRHEDHTVANPVQQIAGAAVCTAGVANGYACNNINMLSQTRLTEMGGGSGSDGWGWRDAETGQYYAIVARSNGTSFVDVTNPVAPVYRGQVPSSVGAAPWRDVKTYRNHAYIVADGLVHGMQVFDMTRLRDAAPGTVFSPDFVYTGIANAHNIGINEESGFAYVVGSDQCRGGLHMVNLAQPANPVFAGCYSQDNYIHDVQCVNYHGPDSAAQGREVCVAASITNITIIDVSDKNNPTRFSKGFYTATGYAHQGWFDPAHRYFYLGDELDELSFGFNARTMVFDLSNLLQPRYVGAYNSATSVIDHNLYVKGDYIYQANYLGGLRVLRIDNPASAGLVEVGMFDTHPESDSRNFAGAWSLYPYFDNGTIAVFDVNSGLFMLQDQVQQSTEGLLTGVMSGQWVAEGFPDQGLTLMVSENQAGLFAFFVWYTYLDGLPYWFAGNAALEEHADGVTMPAVMLDGLEFLTPSAVVANREQAGTVTVTVHSCSDLHVAWDLGAMGSGELDMTRLLGIQGAACSEPSLAADDHDHDHDH